MRTLIICLLLFAGCTSSKMISTFDESELNPAKAIFDNNDVLLYYLPVKKGEPHDGFYLSKRVLKKVFEVEVK